MLYLIDSDERYLLADRVIVCDSFFSRLLGALPAGGIEEGKALIFPRTGAIHTWFMRRPIDLLYFGEAGKIIATHSHVKPFRFIYGTSEARGTVELPSGKIPERLSPTSRLILPTYQ